MMTTMHHGSSPRCVSLRDEKMRIVRSARESSFLDARQLLPFFDATFADTSLVEQSVLQVSNAF